MYGVDGLDLDIENLHLNSADIKTTGILTKLLIILIREIRPSFIISIAP